MTAQEAKQRLERIWKSYGEAYEIYDEDVTAFDMATNALGAIEQIQWERDMAIKQLHDLGYGLGKKPREEVKKASDADRILKILESAKDKNGDVPMSIVRKAFDKLLPSAQPDVPDTNVGDMISRRFVELLAEYHDPELCPYKEYKGKPYFSIKYIENGEEYIGYGTYSPKVLSGYLREYFIEPERKTGKWMARNDDCFECSECHAVIEGDEVYWRNNYFCYHCGADMRGDSDEQQ